MEQRAKGRAVSRQPAGCSSCLRVGDELAGLKASFSFQAVEAAVLMCARYALAYRFAHSAAVLS